MKKIKFFALAAFAMLSLSVNAATVEWANGLLRYSYDDADVAAGATILGFVNGKTAAEQQTLTIPATVTLKDDATAIKVSAVAANAFAGNKNIQSVTFADATINQTINNGAFTGCTALTSVTFGIKTLTIGKAFNGCTALTTVAFTTPAAADFQTIAVGAFEETAIETLDLTLSHVQVIEQLFEEMNTTLTTIKLPATMNKINTNAFKNLATLATIDFTACTTTDFEIEATAFSGAPLIKTLSLPARLKALKKNALAGSNIASLTIASSATAGQPTIQEVGGDKLTTLSITGAFKGVIGDDAAAKPAFTKLTTVTFGGTVAANAITAGAFSGSTKLATVNFNGALAVGAVKAGAFGNATSVAGSANTAVAGIKLTVNYSPTADQHTKAFDVAAFSADGSEGNFVKLVTTTAYKEFLASAAGGSWTNVATANYFSLLVDAALKTANLKVAQNGGTYYYAKLYAGSAYKIAKHQEQDVIVYGAYVDQSDATIYMENLQIINGFYWIPANTPVIVKTKQSADVILTEADAATSSIKKDASNNASSAIYVPTTTTTGLAQIDAVAPLVPYFVAPIADYGFKWSTFKDERVLKGQEAANMFDPETGVTVADFLINCPVIAAGARLNVVWLDGSEDEATAIQFVKNANVESDVIYNLAGQKVDANYKGIIIKNGKKMIQK